MPAPALVSVRRPASAPTLALAVLLAASAGDARAGVGGPDAAGYAWNDVNAGCPVVADEFALANSETFNEVVVLRDVIGPLPIGFEFPFYGITTTEAWVHRKGLVFFEDPTGASVGDNRPTPFPSDGFSGYVAAWWDEMEPDLLDATDNVHWETSPTGDSFKISFRLKVVGSTAELRFEMYLDPDGEIRIEYLSVPSGPMDATIGTESPDESAGLLILDDGVGRGGLTFGTPMPHSICIHPSTALPCATAGPVACGVTTSALPSGPAPGSERYACDPDSPWMGGEEVHVLQLDEVSDVDVVLTPDTGLDQAVFLLDSCLEWDCLAGGGTSLSAGPLAPGTYHLVVDAATEADHGGYELEVTCTPSSTVISCEETITASNLGAPSRLDGYPCLAGDHSGGETFFTLDVPPGADRVVASVESASGSDLSVLLLSPEGALDAADCLAGGAGAVQLLDPAAGPLVIAVDGAAGSESDFTLTVTCSPQLGCPPGAPTIACTELLEGTTVGEPAFVDLYGCATDVYDGAETVFVFENDVAQPVTFLLDSADERLDVFLLSDCDEAACLAAGDSLASAELEPGTYRVVVDGREGAEGEFSLSVVCGAGLRPESVSVVRAPGECFEEHKVAWITPAIPQADVLFSIDLTGSMMEEREQLQLNMQDIIDRLNLFIPDVQFGLISYRDYDTTGTATTPCPYDASRFGSVGDYPYQLEQPITGDRLVIQGAVDGLPPAAGGGDGPESYNRAMYEAANDPAIGWRAGSRRLMVDFGDNVPHDCNVLECFGEDSPGRRGVDLGRDGRPETADDLPTLEVVQGLVDARTALLHLHSSGFPILEGTRTFLEVWDCWAALTGGEAVRLNSDGTVPAGIDLAELIADLIRAQAARCNQLELVAEEGWEDWLVSATPVYVDVTLPVTVDFDIEICVPPDTPVGTYDFQVELHCSGGVIASQDVHVEVTEDCLPSVLEAPSGNVLCLGESATLDGTGLSLVNCLGEVQHQWRDDAGPVGSGPVVEVSPDASTTYWIDVTCSTNPDCLLTESVEVEVHQPPDPPPATAAELADCNLGIEVTWDPATFHGPTGTGVYNVYRSETSCADALTRPPLARGLDALSWIDDTTREDRTYHYVVEAEDERIVTPCRPRGPDHGGAVARTCVDPVLDELKTRIPPGVFATLQARHDGDDVTFTWEDARPLLPGEHFHLLKAVGEPTASFALANGEGDLSLSHEESDTSSPRQFFDLRIANACEAVSADEYPPGYDVDR